MNNSKKSRKQQRKEQRKAKKERRAQYYSRNSLKEQKIKESLEEENEPGKFVLLSKQPKQSKVKVSMDPIAKEKQIQDKLKKQMSKQRNKQLIEANKDEDKEIRRLEKQLKLKKKKKGGVIKSFAADGLDYLLEVCDGGEGVKDYALENDLDDANDDFEEDLDLMLNGEKVKKDKENQKSTNKKQKVESDDEDFDSDEDEIDSLEEQDIEEEDEVENDMEEEEHDELDEEEEDEELDEEEEEDPEDFDSNDEEESSITPSEKVWTDIYGRTRDPSGNIISESTESTSKYIPPALRNQSSETDKMRAEKLLRLKRTLKGHLNRLAESNMHKISVEIENLFMLNSRNDMNETLTKLILEAVASNISTPERLLLEHVMLIAILHGNIGVEVGAYFLQTIIKKFDESINVQMEDKTLDNIICVLAQMFNFRIFDAKLMYEILTKLVEVFEEKQVECIIHVLRNAGGSLRHDDPVALKSFIGSVQQKANQMEGSEKSLRVSFLFDVLQSVKNNNMTKIPNYDPSTIERMKKNLKVFLRKGNYISTLNIGLEDLLKADERGKWWIVGSAWSGKSNNDEVAPAEEIVEDEQTQKLLLLAKKQRMNTDTRRKIFFAIFSSEDYMDAFEKLLRLGLKNNEQREIIHVLLHCCLQEKVYNPFYSVLALKLCEHDRKFALTIKYAIWDKLKALSDCSAAQISHLAKLLTYLIIENGLPLATIKVVEFSDLDKTTLRFVRQILLGILLVDDVEVCLSVFSKITSADLKMFRESLILFMHHFLLRNIEKIDVSKQEMLKKRVKMIEKILSVNERKRKLDDNDDDF